MSNAPFAKNLLIRASAGSGKTYQLSNRIISLIASGVEPSSVVALTFTRKAAGEFADDVLGKLARAAEDPAAARRLAPEIGCPDASFPDLLELVVRDLPRLMLGTMDSFSARVVQAFQVELGLTGGSFGVIEGGPAEAAMDDLLNDLLHDTLDGPGAEAFVQAFRRATAGRQDAKVLAPLRSQVNDWHKVLLNPDGGGDWGPAWLAGGAVSSEWEARKEKLLDRVSAGLADFQHTDKRQVAALDKMVDLLRVHTVGSGMFSPKSSVEKTLWAAVLDGDDPLHGKMYKGFDLPAAAGDALREALLLLARCEMAAALERTAALYEVLMAYDRERERRLRSRGLLGFDELKRMMALWATDEEARLRREAVDFRLDARYQHWLLDEFQDTSTGQWIGLKPLLDEAAMGDEGTLFVVGDAKQAVYAWRDGNVRLFDEVHRWYGENLVEESMDVSFRSCAEVLALVNRVCGDVATVRALYGDAVAERWEQVWHDHRPAEVLAGRRGEARVELFDWEEAEGGTEREKMDGARFVRLAEVLRERGVGERDLTCGVLLRGNKLVRAVSRFLRDEGFDVIEEGERKPAADNVVGVALAALVSWLANPADARAAGVWAMSPLRDMLVGEYGGAWQAMWEGLNRRAADEGYAGMLSGVVGLYGAEWTVFSRRRAADLISAVAALEVGRAVVGAAEVARMLDKLGVKQAPGRAAVQVMTIHKSKGLGFDLVVLPEVPNRKVPNFAHYRMASGEGWVSAVPAAWAREASPEMKAAEERWSEEQCYEDMCMFYVAMTRAKSGLVVLLPRTKEKANSKGGPTASADTLLRSSLGEEEGVEGGEVLYAEGDVGWVSSCAMMDEKVVEGTESRLGEGVPLRRRRRPSREEDEAKEYGEEATGGTAKTVAVSPRGMRFGSRVHQLFEQVGWEDEGVPELPGDDGGKMVARLLREPEVRVLFSRRGRAVELFREQAFDLIDDKGCWVTGVIDRLHVEMKDGKPVAAEVIDFKTDRVDTPDELVARHAPQMRAYREAVAKALGIDRDRVACRLVSTRLAAVVECG